MTANVNIHRLKTRDRQRYKQSEHGRKVTKGMISLWQQRKREQNFEANMDTQNKVLLDMSRCPRCHRFDKIRKAPRKSTTHHICDNCGLCF